MSAAKSSEAWAILTALEATSPLARHHATARAVIQIVRCVCGLNARLESLCRLFGLVATEDDKSHDNDDREKQPLDHGKQPRSKATTRP